MGTALHQTLFTNSLFAYIEFNFLKFPTNIYLIARSLIFVYVIERIVGTALYFFKIADGFVHRFHKSERIRILFDDIFKIHNLMPADNANDDVAFRVAVHARADHLCGAVFEFFHDFLIDFFRVPRDNQKFIRRLHALQTAVCHKRRNEAVQNAHAHGLVIADYGAGFRVDIGIHEIRRNRHDGVQREQHPYEVQVRNLFIDEFGNDVGTARGAVATERHSVRKAADDARNKHGIDGIGALGIVTETAERVGFAEQ